MEKVYSDMTSEWIMVCFIFLTGECYAYRFPKVHCSFSENDSECQDLFKQHALNSETKLLYIHLNDQNNVTDRNKTRNPLLEFVWVNRTSEYLLTYPDDFHPLTFGILADNMFEMEINISKEINETKDSLIFLFSNIVLNITFGEICHRSIHNHTGRDFFENFNIWIGYDYLCFSTAEESGNEISKISTSNILISILGFICILWFPLIFVIMDQNKMQMKRKFSELKSFGIVLNDKVKTQSIRNRDGKLNNDKNSINHIETEFHHTDTYDQGDVPYGIQRMFIAFFHRNVRKEVPMIVSHSRFAVLLVIFLTATAALLINYEINHIPPDIKNYTTLHPLPDDSRFFMLMLCTSSLYYVLILCFFLPVAFKEYTYSFDVYRFLKSDTFLTKIQFSDILGTISDNNIFHNFIYRFFIIFSVKLWIRVIYAPLIKPKFKKRNKMKKCLAFLPCIIAIFCNIVFQLLWTFPLVWCFFNFILNFLNLWYKYIVIKKVKRKGIKRVIKLIVLLNFPILLYYCQIFFFNNSSITASIPSMVKMVCYTCFIALPQVNFYVFRIIFSIFTVLSYCMKLFKTITDLYKELLRMIFKIHEEMELNVHYVKIAEFDFVSGHVFPFRIQLFYFATKVFLTCIFFFVAVEPFFHLNSDQRCDEMPINGIISFFFILFSPALAEFILNSSPECKVMSNKNEIRKYVEKWQTFEKIRQEDINHACRCAPCCEGNDCGKIFTFCIESILGCCFNFSEDKFCQICSISFPDEEGDSYIPNEETQLPQSSTKSTTHYISIKFPESVIKETFQDRSNIGTERHEPVALQSDESSL